MGRRHGDPASVGSGQLWSPPRGSARGRAPGNAMAAIVKACTRRVCTLDRSVGRRPTQCLALFSQIPSELRPRHHCPSRRSSPRASPPAVPVGYCAAVVLPHEERPKAARGAHGAAGGRDRHAQCDGNPDSGAGAQSLGAHLLREISHGSRANGACMGPSTQTVWPPRKREAATRAVRRPPGLPSIPPIPSQPIPRLPLRAHRR